MRRERGIALLVALGFLVSVGGEATAQKKRRSSAAAAAGSQTLERALKLYDGEDYYSASIELFKVVEGESGDTEANKAKAEFWMGKTLYKMKFYSASLSYF